jgi:hypothetical protein
MKKILAIVIVMALSSCGSASTEAPAVDSAAVAVDTVVVAVDSAAVEIK